jgi:FHA domain
MEADPNMPTVTQQADQDRVDTVKPIREQSEYHQVSGATADRPTEPLHTVQHEPLHAVQREPMMAWLIFISAGPRYGEIVRLHRASIVIGRANDCEFVINDSGISRQHARIQIEEAEGKTRFLVQDLESGNGTFVNESRHIAVELHNGDVIRVGRTELMFKCIV